MRPHLHPIILKVIASPAQAHTKALKSRTDSIIMILCVSQALPVLCGSPTTALAVGSCRSRRWYTIFLLFSKIILAQRSAEHKCQIGFAAIMSPALQNTQILLLLPEY